MAEKTIATPVKRVVRFTRTDGFTPTRQGPAASFNLRSPVAFTLAPGEERSLDLGLSCDHPVHIFQARGPVSRGVVLVDGIWAATDADMPLVLRMRNTGDQASHFEEGETVARCTVFSDVGWEVA